MDVADALKLFVMVEYDGWVRELAPEEAEGLAKDWSGGHGARPYIKSAYDERTGAGSLSGFLHRRRLPAHVVVHPWIFIDGVRIRDDELENS